jgi:hypothetical protein
VTLQSAPDLVFDYELDENEEPDVPVNVAAASVNAFYLVNTVHDIAYRLVLVDLCPSCFIQYSLSYGFTEEAFNFQFLNFDKGGEFADGVTVNVQADGLNNANFAVRLLYSACCSLILTSIRSHHPSEYIASPSYVFAHSKLFYSGQLGVMNLFLFDSTDVCAITRLCLTDLIFFCG